MPIILEPVTRDNWRDCAAISVPAEQQRFVNPVTYSLCLCHYGDVWHPLAVVRDGAVAGFVMWGVDDDRSGWIGGLVVDAAQQRQRAGRPVDAGGVTGVHHGRRLSPAAA